MNEPEINHMLNILFCPICGNNNNVSFRFIKNGYNIYRCNGCQHMFVYPQPSQDKLLNIYDDNYYKRGNKYFIKPQTASMIHQQKNDEHKIKIIKKYKKTGKLLDIGCAKGSFLYLAKKEHFQVTGLEVSKYCADYVNNNLGIEVYNCDLLSAKLPSATYDVVTLWDVIEHLNNPVETINEIYRILCPGGIICLSTGDIASFYAYIMGRFWHLLTPPQHLSYFSHKSIRKMLTKSDFTISQITHPGKYATFDFILFKAKETFGRIINPLLWIAKQMKIGTFKVYINLYDIITCIAIKENKNNIK